MRSDYELLRAYADSGDETAFAEVVRRHVNLVYNSAVRLLNGDATLAQDVTQTVFTDLARKAGQFAGHANMAGWLHTSARFAASHAVRSEQRRRTHEQEASAMNSQNTTPDANWTQLRPLIDEAVGRLPTAEREAVLLRFFEGKDYREVGETLGVTESAARMRVERAVEKMREYFTRHGVTTTVALLATTLGAGAANAPAPAGLAASVVGYSLLGAKTVGGMTTGASASKYLTAKLVSLSVGTAVFTVTVMALMVHLAERTVPVTPPSETSQPTVPWVDTRVQAKVPIPQSISPAFIVPAAPLAAIPTAVIPANKLLAVVDQTAPSPTPQETNNEATSSNAPSNDTAPTEVAVDNTAPIAVGSAANTVTPPIVPDPAANNPGGRAGNPAKAAQVPSNLRFARLPLSNAEVIQQTLARIDIIPNPSLKNKLTGLGGPVEVSYPMKAFRLNNADVAQGKWLNSAEELSPVVFVTAAGQFLCLSHVYTIPSGVSKGTSHVTQLDYPLPGGDIVLGPALLGGMNFLSNHEPLKTQIYEVSYVTYTGASPVTSLTMFWLKAIGDGHSSLNYPDLVYLPSDPAHHPAGSPLLQNAIYVASDLFRILQPIAINNLRPVGPAATNPPMKAPLGTAKIVPSQRSAAPAIPNRGTAATPTGG